MSGVQVVVGVTEGEVGRGEVGVPLTKGLYTVQTSGVGPSLSSILGPVDIWVPEDPLGRGGTVEWNPSFSSVPSRLAPNVPKSILVGKDRGSIFFLRRYSLSQDLQENVGTHQVKIHGNSFFLVHHRPATSVGGP